MNTVTMTLGILIASMLGIVFYFFVSERFRRVFLYIIISNIFFFFGQIVSEKAGWTATRLGTFNLLPAILFSVTGLVLIRFLAGPPRIRTNGKMEE